MPPQILSLTHNNITLEFSPERGGLITQIFFGKTPILFLNEETFYDLSKNVRGGIPIMFPNAGPLLENSKYSLKQHGFARNFPFQYRVGENFIEMILLSNPETKKLFPYDFLLKITAEIIQKSVKISLKIQNTGTEKMPIAPGLHPYFFIPNVQKDNFFLQKNEKMIEEYKKSAGETIYTKNPGTFLAHLGENILEFDYDENYKKLWLRSEPGKDFLCIEPTFGDEGALIDDPYILGTNEEKIFSIIIKK